jgi:hypothetical protein
VQRLVPGLPEECADANGNITSFDRWPWICEVCGFE